MNIDPRLYNPLGQVLGMMPPEVQAEMKRLNDRKNIQCHGGEFWEPCDLPQWCLCLAYRLRPGWTPPEPESGMIEVKPWLCGRMWVFNDKSGAVPLSNAPSFVGFRGYRYNAEIYSCLILNAIERENGGYKLRIPDAVVFDRAEVEAAK